MYLCVHTSGHGGSTNSTDPVLSDLVVLMQQELRLEVKLEGTLDINLHEGNTPSTFGIQKSIDDKYNWESKHQCVKAG